MTLTVGLLYAGSLGATDDTGKMVLNNYCLDEDQNRKWERLRDEHAGDPSWQRLYQSRTRICSETERGETSLSTGIVEFESIRREVIEAEKLRNHNNREDAAAG